MTNIFFHFTQNIGRIEETRQKNSQDLTKTLEMLEEWKKLWKKEIIQSYEKYFYSFSTKYWKNGRSQAKKFTRPIKNSGDVGRMEEALEEVNNLKLENIFSFIFQNFLEEWKKLGKEFRRSGKNSGNVGRMEEAVEEENIFFNFELFSSSTASSILPTFPEFLPGLVKF